MARAWRAVHLALVAFVLFLLGGCQDEPRLEVRRWSLVSDSGPKFVQLPEHLSGALLNRDGFFELRSEVELPTPWRGQGVSFGIPFLHATTQLEVNGEPVPLLSLQARGDYRTALPQVYWIGPALTSTGKLALLLRVSARTPWATWLDTVPRLSLSPRGDASLRAMHAWTLGAGYLGLCACILVALSNLLLFRWTREPMNAGIAITFACAAYYPAFWLGITQGSLGVHDVYGLGISLVGLCLATMSVTMMVQGRPFRVRDTLTVFGVMAMLLSPAINPNHGLYAGTAILIVCVGSVAVVYIRLLRAGHRQQVKSHFNVARLGLIGALLVAVPDILFFVGLGRVTGGWRTGNLGIAAGAFGSVLSYSLQYFEAYKDGIRLRSSLEERMKALNDRTKEVQALNVELRRQLAANATELAAALVEASKIRNEHVVQVGDLVDGRYRVVHVLGHGAMGCVYSVVRIADEQAFAMKVILGSHNPVVMARFAREAESALKVESSSVVAVRDVGTTSEGLFFLVMDLMIGPCLADESSRFGEIPWALRILDQIAEGLEAIHDSGVVHRDIKPRNVLLSYEQDALHPQARIVDFGVSALRWDETTQRDGDQPNKPNLTRTGSVVGTPLYMAPEMHFGAKDSGTKSDIFSFGLLAREILVSEPESHFVPLGLLMAAQDGVAPPALRSLQPALAEDVAALFDRCLAFRPEDRPSAMELREVLGRAVADLGPVRLSVTIRCA